ETLVDETRIWGEWADAIGVPRLTFFAALGAIVQQGVPRDRGLFDLVRPGLTFQKAAALRGTAEPGFGPGDLYPDARPALQTLREAGFQVGIAANQPPGAALSLERCDLSYDWLLISDLERLSKPDPAFFRLLVRRAGVPPDRIAYVGDRVDNDVLPAAAAGLRPVHVRRGPWGVIHARDQGVSRAELQTDRLEAVVEWARRAS
ncbi:MAG: HAD-IA family hydrolase, partial [Candidatus Dormibacteraeota bacterium]|nr:HAD-IA family hydrolase [Candidatus Dormibacteraeota bacterium]